MEDLKAIKNDKSIKRDRLRYEKNSIPALMCYLAIVFNVIYFITIYKLNDTYFYNKLMMLSVICNLIFLLMAFLSSEEIKNYKKGFSFLMIGLGVLQIVRLFIYPMKAHQTAATETVGTMVMSDKVFVTCIILLVASAVSLFVGAIIGVIRCNNLQKRLDELKEEK